MIKTKLSFLSSEISRQIIASLLFLLSFASCNHFHQPEEKSAEVKLEQLELGFSFPPVSNQKGRDFTTRQLNDFEIKLVRFAEDWNWREPTPGTYHWEPLDQRMHWVVEENIQLLLTIQSNGPDWACNPENQNERSCVYTDPASFENYISALLQRYPNQISKIQFGNEWASEYWFAGSAEDFILYHNMLYDAVQKYSPSTEVVLGGFSSGTIEAVAFCNHAIDILHLQEGEFITQDDADAFCNQPGALAARQRISLVLEEAKYDWIDLHFYDFVELWPAEYQAFQEAFPSTEPILVSEFGGPNLFYEQPYSNRFQALRLKEYILTLEQMGIPEAYFFKLVQGEDASPAHRESGLYQVILGFPIKKPAYWVFLDFTD
jgi:hypothetical protein